MAPSEGVTLVRPWTCDCTTHDNLTTCAVGIASNFSRLTESSKPPPPKPDWREGLQQAGVLRQRKGGRIEWRGR